MTYTIRSKDRTQSVYTSRKNFRQYALEDGKAYDAELFRTHSKDTAYEVWQMVGGDYGEFEIVEDD